MSYENNGGSAFPVPTERNDNGMTLRDYFAAKAMLGLAQTMPEDQFENVSDAANFIAESSYLMADAMLEARSK